MFRPESPDLPSTIVDSTPPNRETRRRAKQATSADVKQATNLQHLKDDILKHSEEVDAGGGFVNELFCNPPAGILELTAKKRSLSLALDKIHIEQAGSPFINWPLIQSLEKVDIFRGSIKGVTLFDIEKMPLQHIPGLPNVLSDDDIHRMDLVFERETDGAITLAGEIKRILALLAVGRFKNDDRSGNFPEIQALQDRAVAYFDYYTQLMLVDLDQLEDQYLQTRLAGVASISEYLSSLLHPGPRVSLLPIALVGFMAARLGITQSSTGKLYEKCIQNSGPGIYSLSWRKRILPIMNGTASFIDSSELPSDLKPYACFNPEMDKVVSRILEGVEVEDWQNTDELLSDLSSFHGRLLDQIKASKVKRIDINLTEGNLVSKVTLASQYRQTLMLLLHLQKEGQTAFLAELSHRASRGGTGYDIFGFPPAVLRDNPNIKEVILAEVLPKVLEIAHPAVPVSTKIEAFPANQTLDQIETHTETPVFEPKSKHEPKKLNRVLTPIEAVLASPPKTQEAEKSRYQVIYSKAMIERMLPGKRARQDKVERVIRTIKSFKQGDENVKMLKWSGGRAYAVSAGDLRIIFTHQGRSIFRLVAVGDRGEVYEDFTDTNVS